MLDIAMPDMTVAELRTELRRHGHDIPVVFITAHRDESIRPLLDGRDAVACLFKPISEAALVEALDRVFSKLI
ncbi:response regulator [Mesorhizobium sp. CA6]|nr:response regulator [Mesorhizobium sp. CA6]